MPHIQIHPTRIGDKPAVARRLVVSAMMHVQDALPSDMEQMVSNLVREPRGRMIRTVLMDQEAVLGLQAEDAVQHDFTRMGSRYAPLAEFGRLEGGAIFCGSALVPIEHGALDRPAVKMITHIVRNHFSRDLRLL